LNQPLRVGGTWEVPVFQSGDNEPLESDLIFADKDFFRFFTYKFIEGNVETALQEPMTVVITKELSQKLFGTEKSLGKSIKVNNSQLLTVSAVVEVPESNTCLRFSSLANMDTRKVVMGDEDEFSKWGWSNFQTFVLLKDGADPVAAAKTILSLFPEETQKGQGQIKLMPLKEIYFSEFILYGSDYLVSGDKTKAQILGLVAILVLMIALVNFFNISSSHWMDRLKQTGMLKVLGAGRATLVRNVLAEAFLLFFISFLIAIGLAKVSFGFISNYTGIHFNPNLLFTPGFLFIAVAGTFIISILFSFIPAIHIASSNAIDNLHSATYGHSSASVSKGVFVTIQFIIAIILIAFTVLVQKQVNFGSSDLGFNHSNILSVKLTEQLSQKKGVLAKLLDEDPHIKSYSFSSFYPGKINQFREAELTLAEEKKQVSFDLFGADTEFYKMSGLQLISGRFYNDSLAVDKEKLVVNEAFLRENNITSALGGTMVMGRSYEIIGVIKDFHFKPVNQPISPLAIMNASNPSYCHITIQTSDFNTLNTVVENIKKTASDLSPSFPANVSFLDQAVGDMYHSELQFRRTFSLFAGCAIVICCLGILAISLNSCQRRTKEIGIRKVNGGKIIEIMALLNKDFIKWVAVAIVIATPIAWYAMHEWLANFAYKTEISWWIFAMAGLLALGIALLTVSWQSWKAATRNPVEALRYE
jgi:putative ABC transport system permease protein